MIHSQELNLRLKPVERLLRVFNPATGDLIPEFEGLNDYATAAVQRAQQEAQRAANEANRADRAEEALAQALAQLEELKRQSTTRSA